MTNSGVMITMTPNTPSTGSVQAAKNICRAYNGKKVVTFSRTQEMVKFPCRYNAIRDTVCGDWKVTVSPGNMLETLRNKAYVIKTLWVSVERISDGLKWEGRTDLKIARKVRREGLKDLQIGRKV